MSAFEMYMLMGFSTLYWHANKLNNYKVDIENVLNPSL